MLSLVLWMLLTVAALILMTSITNRSRVTLEQAVSRSGCPEAELRTLIKEHLLSYRRKYVLCGPLSLDATKIAEARTGFATITAMRAETDATIRQMAEETATRIAENNRLHQARLDAQREELERMKRVFDEIRQQLGISSMPSHIVAAFQTLGLEPDVSFEAVRQRYRLLAKLHHPDNGGNPADFLRIQTAYDTVISWIQAQP